MQQPVVANSAEFSAALLQAGLMLGIACVCAFLYRRHRKPYLGWFALAWLLYVLRVAAISTFLVTNNRLWLYWHQVVTGWTALVLLWAALVFSRGARWRSWYPVILLFPPIWSYVAIYRLHSFLLAALPAVLFLSLVTFGTGWVFIAYYRRVRSSGAALLAVALMLWGAHHLDYPFLRARGAWAPWGYYIDIVLTSATATGILLLVLDDIRRGLAALLMVSGDLAHSFSRDAAGRLLERLLTLPAVRGSALYSGRDGAPVFVRGAGVCAAWSDPAPDPSGLMAITDVLRSGEPRFVGEWRGPFVNAMPFGFGAILPIFRDAQVTDALVIVGDARDPFAALDESFLVALGQQIGTALRGADLYLRLEARTAALEHLSSRMVAQHEQERRRLSQHLHDETAQVFTAVKLQLGLLSEQEANPTVRGRLESILELMDDGIAGIRNVTNDLRPSLLDDLGLMPALRSLATVWTSRTEIAVDLAMPPALPKLADEAELALYRALQESLSNVAQHAAARAVAVVVRADGDSVWLDVSDDGRGFGDGEVVAGIERPGHLGIAGMRERIAAIGGDVVLGASSSGGARVSVRVPAGAR